MSGHDELLLVRMPGRVGGKVTIGHVRLPLVQMLENVCDVAATEVVVHQLDSTLKGWHRNGVTSPLRRLVRDVRPDWDDREQVAL